MKETQLTSLNQTHFSAANAMRNVDDSMEECIDCILRSMNLITWLRDKLKSNFIFTLFSCICSFCITYAFC